VLARLQAGVPDAEPFGLQGWCADPALLRAAAHAQNADGSFYCILLSAAGDRQWGTGDPCGTPSAANPHPDDIAMILVAAYEQLLLANASALLAPAWPALRRAVGYYIAHVNSTAWRLPYQVHETYDAVPIAPVIAPAVSDE
jgi:hypothetical protein